MEMQCIMSCIGAVTVAAHKAGVPWPIEFVNGIGNMTRMHAVQNSTSSSAGCQLPSNEKTNILYEKQLGCKGACRAQAGTILPTADYEEEAIAGLRSLPLEEETMS